jgi:opacity protein-like surface antigen
MKKIILLFTGLISAAAFNIASAQESKSFSFGFKVSPNFSWVKVQEGPMTNNGLGLGFTYGVTADFMLLKNQNYWLSTELDVTSLPSKVQHAGVLAIGTNKLPYKNVNFNYSNQYLQIPVSIKFKTDDLGGMKYYMQFGLGMSFAMQKKVETISELSIYGNSGITSHDPNNTANSIYDFDGNGTTSESFLDDINTFRGSMIIGAGIEYHLSGNMNLVAGLKFDNGFTDIFTDARVNARNNFLSLQVGLTF